MKALGRIALLCLAAAVSGPFVHAQQTVTTEKQSGIYRSFHLVNSSDPNDGNTVLTAVRLMLDPSTKMYLDPGRNTIMVFGTEQNLALAQTIIAELDKPKKQYRLTFTITTFDSGKKVGDQHYSVVIAMGGRTTLKNGSKVPVATGSYGKENNTQETQFTYLDVGINMDLQIDQAEGGARLHSKFEQSSATETHTIAGVQEPVVRQSVLDSSSFLTIGKQVTLGSIDVTDSPRHLDIAVVMEPVQ